MQSELWRLVIPLCRHRSLDDAVGTWSEVWIAFRPAQSLGEAYGRCPYRRTHTHVSSCGYAHARKKITCRYVAVPGEIRYPMVTGISVTNDFFVSVYMGVLEHFWCFLCINLYQELLHTTSLANTARLIVRLSHGHQECEARLPQRHRVGATLGDGGIERSIG